LVLRRWLTICLLCVLAGLAPAQRPQRSRAKPPPEPDEATADAEPEYTFNPIQAQKELKVGDFYFKKKSYKAAASRYERATKWQPDFADAYFKLGEATEKLGENEKALAAFQKYLQLSPPPHKAEEVKKKIAKLQSQKPPSK
jgi:tetratricopeptide (TPR) repeat protein